MQNEATTIDTATLLNLWLDLLPVPPPPAKPAHPWRSKPAVQRHVSESRQVERTYINAQKGWNLLGRKRRA